MVSMKPNFWVGDFPCGRWVRLYRLGMTVLRSAPRATVHVQPLHPWCVHSTFLYWKSKQALLRFQIFLTKKNGYVYNSSLTRQLCAISWTVFCKLSFWLSSALHRLSNPKRILHYKSFESGLAPTKPTQMLLPKPLQPVQAKSGRLRS